MYSSFLAPPNIYFWLMVAVGAVFTFGPYLYKLVNEGSEDQSWDKFKGAISFGIFSAITTVVILHLFGDARILGWLYKTPDPNSSLVAPLGVVSVLLVIVASIVVLYAIRAENGAFAIAAVILSLILMQFITGLPIFPWLIHHWPVTLGLFVVNLVIGALWAIFYKWDGVVVSNRRRYDVVRSKWLQSKGLDEKSDFSLEEKAEWEEYFQGHYRDEEGLIEYRPRYRDHKSELIGWMVLWPISMFETFLFDVLAEFFVMIYKQFGGILEMVTTRRWQGTEGHMLTDEEREILKQSKR